MWPFSYGDIEICISKLFRDILQVNFFSNVKNNLNMVFACMKAMNSLGHGGELNVGV